MSSSNPFSEKISKVATAILNKISTHENKTGSSSQKGHVQASSQSGLADVSGGAAGTDNGIYARADHQHALSSAYATASHTHSDYVTTSDSRLTNARTPTSHTHGDITNDGKLGSTANKPLITTTSGKITTGSFGTSANTFCQGNDSRLSNARTPTSHSHGSLANGGTLNSDITSVNKIAVTDSSNNLKTISQLPYSKISGTPSLSSVATSGSYNDLSNKPTIPSAYTHPSTKQCSYSYTHPSTHPSSMITGLSTVATSGNYNDLSNKPNVPVLSSSSSVEVTNPVTLPSGYTQLNYIEGNHSQYFNTGWKFNNTYPTKIECKFMPYDTLGVSGYGIPYGLQTSSYSKWIYPFYMNNGNFNLHIGSSAGVDVIPISFSSVYDTVFIINNGSWSRTINNVTTTGSYSGSIDTGSNLFILGGSYGTNALNQMSGRIYSMKITVGSNLVRNYIPVRRNSDNKCGLYDLVNNNFIVSDGGDVTGGDVVTDTTLSASVSVNNLPKHTHSDYLTSHQDISGKLDKSQGISNSGKFLKVNSSGNVACESVTIPSAYTHPIAKQCNANIPTDVSELADSDDIIWGQLESKYDSNGRGLTEVAFSGSYNDLDNKPTIPTIDSSLSSTSTNAVQNKVIKTALGTKADQNHASSGVGYGVATTSKYGHVKVSNSLTAVDSFDASQPVVLSAYQGKRLKNYIDGIYQTKIIASSYNVQIDSTDTVITVSLIDAYRDAVSDTSVHLFCNKGYFNNDPTVHSITATTDSNGKITATWTASEWGLCTFTANESNTQVNVTGWREAGDSIFHFKYNDKMVQATAYVESASFPTSWDSFSNRNIPSELIPEYNVAVPNVTNPRTFIRFRSNGSIEKVSVSGSTLTSRAECLATWKKQ